MESKSQNSKHSLWIGELDQSMDENYLKEACKKYSKKSFNFYFFLFFINIYRYQS